MSMRGLMKLKPFVYLSCLVCLLFVVSPVVAQTHDHHSATATSQNFLGKGDGVTTCAVTGEELADKSIHGEFFGRTVYFCCGGCLAKAQKEPALYIKATEQSKRRPRKHHRNSWAREMELKPVPSPENRSTRPSRPK